MDVIIAAVGRIRRGPAKDLFEDYVKRLTWKVTLKEVDERGPLRAEALKRKEAELILAALPERAFTVALDERGKQYSSTDFARQIGRWREQTGGPLAFVIGGADGLHQSVLDAADATLSLGAMTWPHRLARCLLAEQLYRAQSILSGHPYHRE
ncbi:MAG: 23S rRNA (pseudouridine(1915)-N(3))-methyltransferase RlmH [Pseudomonadota bacterium]